jgi:lysozyme family protein
MTNLVALRALNAERWARCAILPKRQAEVDAVARKLCAPDAKLRYQFHKPYGASRISGSALPSFMSGRPTDHRIGTNSLGKGDPLNQISRHRPKGRGPFLIHPGDAPGNDAFHRGAVDALENCPPFAGRWTDWTIGGVLTLWLLYNGTGYEDYHHEASPYDWGATNIEEWGKYVRDGVWSAHAWDSQVGCAAMLKGMMAIDPTIKFAA